MESGKRKGRHGTGKPLVVVGASLAGLRAVEAARKHGYDGRIVLIGAEVHLPYDRPALSKEVLIGAADPTSTRLRERQHYDDLDVELHLGVAATGLDLAARRVLLGVRSVPFDSLIVATGVAPRCLATGHQREGVHVLRTLDDLLALRVDLETRSSVVIVGAGFIGAEVASSARALGLDVTIVEAAERPLSHAIGPEMGGVCARLHAENGTRLLCGVGVKSIEGRRRVNAVLLTDGTRLPADVVVVGIGVTPNTAWLDDSGLTIDDGVVCDETLAAGPPGIYAAGDVVRWTNPLFGESMRLEHWTNAAEQGGLAARNLLDGPDRAKPCAPVPYFWSDQYGVRIQAVGRTTGDEMRVLSGSLESRRFVAVFRRGDRLCGALAMDLPKQLMKCRVMIGQQAAWSDVVADRSLIGAVL